MGKFSQSSWEEPRDQQHIYHQQSQAVWQQFEWLFDDREMSTDELVDFIQKIVPGQDIVEDTVHVWDTLKNIIKNRWTASQSRCCQKNFPTT